MNLTNDGLIDMAFVLPEMMGRGVASTLYASIEDHAVSSGLSELRTEASHLARPFFERHGWRVINAQTVDCNGVTLENYYMTKRPLGN
jgi:putative acetyltransferase